MRQRTAHVTDGPPKTPGDPAGFVSDGSTTVDGVTRQHLHATTPGAVPLSPWDQIIDSEPDNPRVSALDLWIDSSDIVVKAQITVSGTNDSAQLTPEGVHVVQQYLKRLGLNNLLRVTPVMCRHSCRKRHCARCPRLGLVCPRPRLAGRGATCRYGPDPVRCWCDTGELALQPGLQDCGPNVMKPDIHHARG